MNTPISNPIKRLMKKNMFIELFKDLNYRKLTKMNVKETTFFDDNKKKFIKVVIKSS